MKKEVLFFSFIRSEYGHLKPLMAKFQQSSSYKVSLAVGGTHLSADFGSTSSEILKDGFKIDHLLPFLVIKDEDVDVLSSIATLQTQLADLFHTVKPAAVVILGDRYELMPVATACLIANIPLVHLSGGDVTEGAIDNQIRHAITKMASLHYPTTSVAYNNILKMGEEEWRICCSGEPGLDAILSMKLRSMKELCDDLGLDPKLPIACATFHPETIGNKITAEFVEDLLKKTLAEGHFQIVITAANSDEDGMKINKKLQEMASKYPGLKFVQSLGQLRYYSLLKYAKVIFGNSSSGIIEAQSFEVPVVNIGKRQHGRFSNPNVMNVDSNVDSVLKALGDVTSKKFQEQYQGKPNVYGDGSACNRILSHFEANIRNPDILLKRSAFGTA